MPISQLKVVRIRKRKNRKVPLLLIIVATAMAIIFLNIFIGSESKDPFASLDETHQYEACPSHINFTYEPLKITEGKVIAAVKKGERWRYCEINIMSQLSEEELSSSNLSP